MVLAAGMMAAVGQDVEIIQTPDGAFEIDAEGPMGLNDIAAVFPFAGPFAASDDGTPGDRMLHESLGMDSGIDDQFLQQLIPVLQSRWPSDADAHPCGKDVARLCPHADAPLHCLGLSTGQVSPGCQQEIKHTVPFLCASQIDRYCSDDLDRGIIPCLEAQGANLGQECTDAIVAAKHVLSSIRSTHQNAVTGDTKKKPKPPPGAAACPSGWDGPKDGGCCTRRWSATCAAECAEKSCAASSKWQFKWLDFRTHPYVCCPKVADRGSKYVGGQPFCPRDWNIEQGKNPCCRRPWQWKCGLRCAQDQCDMTPGFHWVDVVVTKEQYRCCPEGAGPAQKKPDKGSKDSKSASSSKAKASKKVKATIADSKKSKDASASDTDSKQPADGMPAAWGANWMRTPIDLSSNTFTGGSIFVAGVIACLWTQRYLRLKAQEAKEL
eukprot:gnl/TRDRNA2_/TRDRNA2_191113_c0_seq1.p1 gnl/TRDRNA2_/TRDRNA2_191113_c0~~gnl/TRDRNA2_/TRDRNA2_191113_c0_seq1.p1  ORF type:complete len:466 (+),score=91.88 gnl/TRDRNA2_/TRDRNA2_191113_c0_seq1:90-1400(+)